MNITKNRSVFWFLLLCFFLVITCRQITTITIVHPDGSLERTIRVEGDSSDVFDSAIPLPESENWSVIEEGESDTSDGFVYTIHGSFRNPEGLNREFAAPESGENLPQRRVELEKRFGWFYSFLTYREIYPRWNGFTALPLDEYFSEAELHHLHLYLSESDSVTVSPQDSLDLEQKFYGWMFRNVYEETFNLLMDIADQEIYPGLTPGILAEHKETMWEVFRDSVSIEDQGITEALTVAGRILPSDNFNRLLVEHQSKIDSLEEKYDSAIMLDDVPGNPEYTYNDVNVIEMPGLILDTNSDDVEGNRISWQTDNGKYFVYDYEMWVTSRVVNRWAIWVTGVLLVLIISGIIVSFVRPRGPENNYGVSDI